MNKIKFIANKKIKLNGIVYKPYLVGNLPKLFGRKYIFDGEDVKDGISEWFNYKGLTYVEEKLSVWDLIK
jgi:hypothetical protein